MALAKRHSGRAPRGRGSVGVGQQAGHEAVAGAGGVDRLHLEGRDVALAVG